MQLSYLNPKLRILSAEPRSANRWPFLALAFVGLVGAALRYWQAGESLWIDELHTAWCALGNLGEVAPRAEMGNQSPLFFWLQWLLSRAFDPSEITFRLPSLIAGLLLPLAIYGLTIRWTKSPWLGVFAAALVAVDHLAIFYATEARPYALIQLLAVLHVALIAELIERPTVLKRLSFILGAALLFYLHYTTALLFAAEVVFLGVAFFFLIPARNKLATDDGQTKAYTPTNLATDLLLVVVLLLPAIPNLLAIYARRDNWAAFVEQKPVWSVLGLLPWTGSVLVVIAGVVLIRWLRRLKIDEKLQSPLPPAATLLAALWLLVPLTLAWIATATDAARLFFPRYLVASAPAAFVLTAFCLRLVPWRIVQIPVAAAILIYAVYSSQIIQQIRYDGRIIGDRQEDWRGAVAYLNQQLPQHRYPILLRSGLIEASAMQSAVGTPLSEYCLYPLTSLYIVETSRTDLVPLRNANSWELIPFQELQSKGGVWIVGRGDERSLRWIEFLGSLSSKLLASPNRRTWKIQESQSFGKVKVYLVTPDELPLPDR